MIRSRACFLALAAALFASAAGQAQTFETVLSSNLFQPAGVTVSTLNHYIISDTANHRIVEFNADTRAFSVLAGPERAPFEPGAVDGQRVDARFRNPQGILSVGDKVYVADAGNHAIREIGADGAVRTIAGDIEAAHEVDDFGGNPGNWGLSDGPAMSAKFNAPSGIAYEDNRLYIADSGNRAIRLLDLSNDTVSTLVRSGLQRPVALVVGPGGSILIADSGAHSIKIWRRGDTTAKLLAGSGSSLGRGYRDSSIATNALFSAPTGLYYREATDELIVADSGNSVLRVVKGVSTGSPKVETFANTSAAGLQTPIAVTRDAYGVYLVCDASRNALTSVITVRLPRIQKPEIGYIVVVNDPFSGLPIARLVPVSDSTFDNFVRIAVSGDSTAQHYFTYLAAGSESGTPQLPGTNDTTALNFVNPTQPAPPEDVLNNISINPTVQPRQIFRIKAFSSPKGSDERIPSLVTEATFRFKCATPQLDSQAVPGTLVFKCNTTNSVMYYTLDGSEPNKDGGLTTRGPIRNGQSIPLILGTNTLKVKARAYADQFLPSDAAKAEFSPNNFIPNRISLGFENGEASTRMRAAAGQRYFAPVTLSLMPGAQAYGLQFDLNLEPNGAPADSDYHMAFQSRLVEDLGETNRYIPPTVFTLAGTNFVTNAVAQVETNFTYAFAFTNTVAGAATNYLVLTNKLPEVTPVVTTTFITNLGQLFPITTTNYITNTFDLVSENVSTNSTNTYGTNYLYSYTTPGNTNFVRTDKRLDDFTTVIITNFVPNLGQLFPVATTNILTNAFNLLTDSRTTNVITTYETNYAYRASSPPVVNELVLNARLPDSTTIIVTNFVTNLGQLFPISTTNVISNVFNLVSSDVVTTSTNRTETNFSYRAVTPGFTNIVVLDSMLLDRTAVIVTNFVTNLGRLFPVKTTNFVTNAFNLLSAGVVTNETTEVLTNFTYEAITAPQTNTLVLSSILQDSTAFVVTNLVPNMGQLYPVLTTNIVTNAFNWIGANVESNETVSIFTNFLYRAVTPPVTNFYETDRLLPENAPFEVLTPVTNLGQIFLVSRTNTVTNSFNLVTAEVVTNTTTDISTGYVYRAISKPTTNYIEVNGLLPDQGEVVTVVQIQNFGAFIPVSVTNVVGNSFELVNFTVTNPSVTTNVTPVFTYMYIPPVGVSNKYLSDRLLADGDPLLATNYFQNGQETIPVAVSGSVGPDTLREGPFTSNGKSYYLYTFGPGNAYVLPNPVSNSIPSVLPVTGTTYVINSGHVFSAVYTNSATNAFALVSSGFNTNVTFVAAQTNALYANHLPVLTNYISFPTNLPDVAPVVTSATVTNFGQSFTTLVTNYVSNALDFISIQYTTNRTVTVETNVLYQFVFPAVTNYLNLTNLLPNEAPVVSSVTISNLGRPFTAFVTNMVPNTFDLLDTSVVTDRSVTVVTNFIYEFHVPGVTNQVVLNEELPDQVPVVATNFVSNLGRLFPVTVTNYLSNSFRLAQIEQVTNRFPEVVTNIVYAFEQPAITNLFTLSSKLPDQVPVVTTNFISNLGQLFPIAVTNYLNNTFELLETTVVTSTESSVATNILYRLEIPGVTNYLNLASKLPDSITILSTNFVTNLAQVFPITVTNVILNQFDFLGTNYNTNVAITVETNIIYEFHSAPVTNFVHLDFLLPDFVDLISTNFITNLGQSFPVLSTNHVLNVFDLLSTNYSTNTTSTVEYSYLYSFIVPGAGTNLQTVVTTNLVNMTNRLADVLPVISITGFVTNLNQVFPVYSTNYITNSFQLIGTTYITNTVQVFGTNVARVFADLVITNSSQNWLAVGWIERFGRTNLFNTKAQHLLSFSQPHDTVFRSVDGEAVAGAFSFIVPTNAASGDSFTVRVARPSATADGVGQDMFIQAPDESNTNSAVKAVRTLWVSEGLEPFSARSIRNLQAFATVINESANPVANFLKQRMEALTPNSVSKFLTGQLGAATFTDYLVQVLNNIITGPSIYSPELFPVLSDEARKLQSRDLDAGGVMLLNRLLLQETFPNEIRRNPLGYVAGDVSDFRWFNAGEFGDGSILNNDLTELQQSIVYSFNIPLTDSDYMDAMDTCCYTEEGQDLSSMNFADGNNLDINRIAFGDGSRFAPLGNRPNARLEVNDLFVAFRRSLDPNLVWYERYWSNGMRQATIISNTFRGEITPLNRQSVSSGTSIPKGPRIQSTAAPTFTLSAGTAAGMPGTTVAVPIKATVQGGYPLRVLMFTVHVETADGTLIPTSSLHVTTTDALGSPTTLTDNGAGISGAVWLDNTVTGLLGEGVVGTVLFTIPATAQPNAIYYVKLDHVSGSPNGISLFPSRSSTGLVAMSNRTTSMWNDGIPDSWRIQYFGSANNLASDPNLDADADGLTNMQEFKAGTSPIDPNDNLRVRASVNGRGLKLGFHSAAGRKYLIEGSVTLLPGSWSVIQSDVFGTGSELEVPGAASGAPYLYYRVRLQE